MKKTIATLCLLGSTIALSACDTAEMGHVDTAPPYSMGRTAVHEHGHSHDAVVPAMPAQAERVFQRAQTK